MRLVVCYNPTPMSDDLSEQAVSAALTTAWLGRPYRYVARTGSTNDDLKQWAAGGAPHGAVLLTDFQSAGRGRLDRRWEAPPGTSLLFSALLRPVGWPAERGAWLTMLAALAAAEAIEAVVGLPAGLKWPNDVLLDADGWRKAAGLLLDTSFDAAGGLETAVIGIGVNVNIGPADLPAAATPATSLLVACGRPVSRRALLIELLARLEQGYAAAAAGQSPAPGWSARLLTLGQGVHVTSGATAATWSGTAEGIDEWGRLLVRDAAGHLHTIAAGDVTLRGH